MKSFLFIAVLILLSGAMFANPLTPRMIQQFWFNDTGEMMIQFGYQAEYALYDGALEFYDGTGTYYYPAENLDEVEFPYTINAAVEMPGFAPNPLGGTMRMTYQEYIHEEAHWGDDISNDFTPLTGNQSAVQTPYSVNDPEGGHDIGAWAKCPDYTTVEYYHFPARGQINIQIHDYAQNPVEGVPVYIFNQYTIAGTSDASGVLSFQHIPIKLQLLVYQPGSNFTVTVLDSTFFVEPGQEHNLTAILNHTAADDPVAIPVVGKLEVNPSVCVAGQPLNVKYDGLTQGAMSLELYDLKGKHIGTYDYLQTQPWTPPKLPNGMYLLRLTHEGKSLATTRFINLK